MYTDDLTDSIENLHIVLSVFVSTVIGYISDIINLKLCFCGSRLD